MQRFFADYIRQKQLVQSYDGDDASDGGKEDGCLKGRAEDTEEYSVPDDPPKKVVPLHIRLVKEVRNPAEYRLNTFHHLKLFSLYSIVLPNFTFNLAIEQKNFHVILLA